MELSLKKIFCIVAAFAFPVLIYMSIVAGWSLPVAHFLFGPHGTIFVSSPSVYTRERLVNDRYEQDFWLRSQLKILDDQQLGFSLIADQQSDLSLDVGASVAKASKADDQTGAGAPDSGNGGTADGNRQPSASPIDIFRMRASARDNIRQSILENLLDDRHDLTGNSVYGLKFDTTVYPGAFANSSQALVRVSVKPPKFVEALTAERPDSSDNFGDIPFLIKQFYKLNLSFRSKDGSDPSSSFYNLYTGWLENLEFRLNHRLSQLFDTSEPNRKLRTSCDKTEEEREKLIVEAIKDVFSANDVRLREMTLSPETQASQSHFDGPRYLSARFVNRDGTWNNYMLIRVTDPGLNWCGKQTPRFSLFPLGETVYALPGVKEDPPGFVWIDQMTPDAGPSNGSGGTANEKNGDSMLKVYAFDPERIGRENTLEQSNDSDIYHYQGSAARLLEYLRKEHPKFIQKFNPKLDKSISIQPGTTFEYLYLPSGYFNFLTRIANQDMYAYAVFPRAESQATLETIRDNLNGGVATGSGAVATTIGERDRRSTVEAKAVPLSVGFADASATKSVDFGWAMTTGPDGAPLQKSQFALISVPAWTNQLDIDVSVGWLSWNAVPMQKPAYHFTVPIRPDYESIDTFITGWTAARRPAIDTTLMRDEKLILSPCGKASVLIPGQRLWRSAVVTYGAHAAKRITVLPNMRGIIAEFDDIGPQDVSPQQILRVWTSEGAASTTVPLVIPANNTTCPRTAPAVPASPIQ